MLLFNWVVNRMMLSVLQNNHMEKVGQPVFMIELKTEVFVHLCLMHSCLSDDACIT